jgi:hypothetical protein
MWAIFILILFVGIYIYIYTDISTKISAELPLYLERPKLSTSFNLPFQAITTRSHNFKLYLHHQYSTPHTIHAHNIYIYKRKKNLVLTESKRWDCYTYPSRFCA